MNRTETEKVLVAEHGEIKRLTGRNREYETGPV